MFGQRIVQKLASKFAWPLVLVLVAAVLTATQFLLDYLVALFPASKPYGELVQHGLTTVLVVLFILLIEKDRRDSEREAAQAAQKTERDAAQAAQRAEREAAHAAQEAERKATREQIQGKFDDLLKVHFPLGIKATSIGLTAIHNSRKDALSHLGDIDKAIDAAKYRLLLMGVAFKEALQLDSKFDGIVRTVLNNPGMDVRFLALNPLSSPAVFRSFLECPSRRFASL
jgi:hypothetical protein